MEWKYGITREFYLSAKNGCQKVLRFFLKELAFACPPDNEYNSLLHYVTMGGHMNIIKMLGVSRQDALRRNISNICPIDCAIQSGHQDALNLLLKKAQISSYECVV